MFIINHKKIFIGISIALVALSILAMFVFGFNFGIDFKGGALIEVTYSAEQFPTKESLADDLENLNIGNISLQPTRESGYIVKTRDINEVEHQALLEVLSKDGEITFMREESFSSIGPSVGRELAKKAIIAIILVSLGIILFIAYTFRKSSVPVSSWKYGFIAFVTLLHDVIIPAGVFVILSKFTGVEIDTLFVVAILTILGLSVSDTIVIFDRIRENLHINVEQKIKENFSDTVGKSLEQSFGRSIATSLCVILVLLALVFWGPDATKQFSIILTLGMFLGTYSSIFLASSLLVWVNEKQEKK